MIVVLNNELTRKLQTQRSIDHGDKLEVKNPNLKNELQILYKCSKVEVPNFTHHSILSR